MDEYGISYTSHSGWHYVKSIKVIQILSILDGIAQGGLDSNHEP